LWNQNKNSGEGKQKFHSLQAYTKHHPTSFGTNDYEAIFMHFIHHKPFFPQLSANMFHWFQHADNTHILRAITGEG
jgi:hypothetical protein